MFLEDTPLIRIDLCTKVKVVLDEMDDKFLDNVSEWIWWYWQGDKPNKDVVNYIRKNYKPGTTYADFAKDFTAELFDPREFADIVNSSGAKYFVLTSKHHEGFTMWPSRTSWNWNAKDIGPKRDIVGEIKESFKSFEIHFGLYFSQLEWFHPMFLHDSKFNTTMYVDSTDVHSVHELIEQLVRTVSCGGNLLLNIGPDMHGKIPAIFEDRLRELGRFIFANSEALYGTKPWIFQNDTGNIWSVCLSLRTETCLNLDDGKNIWVHF
uniref:alpha-L-fucosidase n=1 Tax=Heterorhabditis bacteriophora TaxID=37862 RepID=A0A1I7XMD8_HETBA